MPRVGRVVLANYPHHIVQRKSHGVRVTLVQSLEERSVLSYSDPNYSALNTLLG